MTSSRAGTVAELLLDRAEARATGVLTLIRGQVRKQLFLRDGALVSAESNLREEALGELLVTLGLLPRSRLHQLLAEVKLRGQRMGTVLLELHWATPDDVLAALREQVRRRAQSCLRWSEAEGTFEAGTDFVGTLIEHRFELPWLVFCGLREAPNLDLLTPRLDQTPEALVRLAPRYRRWQPDFELAFGPELPAVLAEPSELGALVLRPDAGALVHGLEALLATGLVQIEVPAAASTSAIPAAIVGAAADYESGSFAAATSRVDPHSGFLPPPTSGGASDWRSTPGSEAGPGEFPGELALEYLQMHGKSPAQLLGVADDATRTEIDTAYRRRQEAVDRAAAGTLLHPKLAEMIEAYTRAYMALTAASPAASGSAASGAGAPEASPANAAGVTSDPLGAELAFAEGRSLLASGRAAAAVAPLRRAVDRRPDQAAYHAWLGWTLFRAEQRQAMPEALDRLEHAIAVDPDSVDGHSLLGQLLVTLGDPGRARVHLERTVALRPEQQDAVDLLARLYVESGEPEQAQRLYRRVRRP
jgi:Flp pilus assembly protein TadD